jgi:hypothetical protein
VNIKRTITVVLNDLDQIDIRVDPQASWDVCCGDLLRAVEILRAQFIIQQTAHATNNAVQGENLRRLVQGR